LKPSNHFKENSMITLERAIALAAQAHAGTLDKGLAPYILHPLRVMQAQSTTEARIVAVFHDVCEDCSGWSFGRLPAEGFTDDMIDALKSVTKIEGESYEDFVRRAAANPIGRAVKLADLRDNLDIGRIAQLTVKDMDRVNKYKRAVALLESI
jgi:(p)ppGpp synthase/HD superfamily hydrolase